MSKNRTTGLRRGARAMGVGAAATVAMGLFSTGAANADTFVPLPDGERAGPGVTVKRIGESALISPSMAANGAGRVVWVSGTATADVTATPEGEPGPENGPAGAPGTNNSSTHGLSQLNTGYIVGCQVSIGDDAISAGMSGSIDLDGGSVGGSIGLELGPGEVKFVQIELKNIPKAGTYSIQYQDVEIQLQGCAGYAQARAYTVVEIIGDHYSKTTLYGAPFSIG
ncbi:MspA family porin [Nocardia donostiensis]|uniref:MspA family protein n=1 Tax=Nocardia donostiensis TaxID=1538463 RepID=A0A1W0AW89_9NOCA|nr:MspA family porin [Nocardia donostiensis]ONM48333.1 mspA family protein [Nocardia donostiensis]OQS14475.1 mspA family protein [Nocardia donostiensis]OQS20558.1 mspA family protein [Nocardia donostiensis]